METLHQIIINTEAGNAGVNEAIFCFVCVILVAAICYYLPDTAKVKTIKK